MIRRKQDPQPGGRGILSVLSRASLSLELAVQPEGAAGSLPLGARPATAGGPPAAPVPRSTRGRTFCASSRRRFHQAGRVISTLRLVAAWLVASAVLGVASAKAATLEVGPGKALARIEQAIALARPGDVVLVYPQPNGEAYQQTAVMVDQPRITIRSVVDRPGELVAISGKGFDYSGRGQTPRAIFQFNRGADGCVLEGFELSGAHNNSHNGAGVRINQANYVTVRRCVIHGNDMGIMSNGNATPETGLGQRIEYCRVFGNGDRSRPGFNHNLYLGGTSVLLQFCEIHSSLTGHNVKSRAHHTRVEYCYIHDSANREFDLVDAAETAWPNSDAVLLGNVIVKDANCQGNRGVVHFGQDGGGEHNGTLHLAFNTIVTPFISPVIGLSAPKARAQLVGNLVTDGGVRQNNQTLAGVSAGASLENISGQWNWLSGGFRLPAESRLDPATNRLQRIAAPMFVDRERGDFRLRGNTPLLSEPVPLEHLQLPAFPGAAADSTEPPLAWQYRHPAGRLERPDHRRPAVGACAAE